MTTHGRLGARGHARGNSIRYDEDREIWCMPDGRPVDENAPCARCGQRPVPMRLPTESGGFETVLVDYCLWQMIRALNGGAVPTVGCCCGHGVGKKGYIQLVDGRRLLIYGDKARAICARKKA